ncbi:LysR family transcriptional regulator [Nitrogeniibacter aestuarii]|uniref:LysR family transcriptional regulator n=1 Tax=Nitrogeniibacter aestuarii TaxID=2815343 RepID=UPI001E3ADA4E|nr:LysR family transcriptional regulator [Nitrogeniibacter aestuarii]
MDRFHAMQVFVAVAEMEGFASGARRMNMSPPAVTRAVAALEARLGVRLLHRSTRHVRVTEAGARYLEDARRILAEVVQADDAAAGINAAPRGNLTVTASVLFGQIFVMPGIVDYLQRYPQTRVDALFVDRVVNFIDEGVDVAVRIGELPDSSLRARRVGQVRMVLCASPDYLARRGLPASPDELAEHDMISSSAGTNAYDWRFSTPEGHRLVRLNPRLSVSTNDGAISAAVEGFGITRLLSYQVAPHLADGRLKILLAEFEPPPRPVHLVHREGPQGSRKVRAFVDLLAQRLMNDPALN